MAKKLSKGEAPEHKLTPEHRVNICKMIAQFMPVRDIKTQLHEEGISISPSTIIFYQKSSKWAPAIEKMRNEYLSNIMEVPIAHKRVRLERLEMLYKQAQTQRKPEVSRSMLAAARDEIEGKNVNITAIMNKYEGLSDDELEDRRQEILGKIKDERVVECQGEPIS